VSGTVPSTLATIAKIDPASASGREAGRSSQPWDGNDMDTYADDLAAVLDALNLPDVVLVRHSTGGGEVTRYMGRHNTSRVAKAVLVGAIPPLMLKSPANPGGLPIDVFDGLRKGVASDRSKFYEDLSEPFFGANRPGAMVSQGLRNEFWFMSMQVGLKGAYDCIKVFSETDLHRGFGEDRRADVDHPW
jgi:non-heme chloroperoxidase